MGFLIDLEFGRVRAAQIFFSEVDRYVDRYSTIHTYGRGSGCGDESSVDKKTDHLKLREILIGQMRGGEERERVKYYLTN